MDRSVRALAEPPDRARLQEKLRALAEGIAEAKARGVRFGRPAPVLPDNFDQVYQQWQEGALSVRKAAGACGMTESSFYYAATRKARSAQAT